MRKSPSIVTMALAVAVIMPQTTHAQVSTTDLLHATYIPYGAYDANVNDDVTDDDVYAIQYFLSFPGPHQNFSHPGSFGKNARDVTTALADIEDEFAEADFAELDWSVSIDGALADNTVTALDSLLPINFLYRNGPIYQNSVNPLDVNTDNIVSARDALNVINHLNTVGSALPTIGTIATKATEHPMGRALFGYEPGVGSPYPINLLWIPNHRLRIYDHNVPEPYFVDVNGDGVVTASDALVVINYLNSL